MTTSVSADSINTAVGSESRSSQLSTPSDRTLADNLPGTAAVSDVAENEENEAQLKGYAAAGFVTALPYVLYALGVAWVLLFPLVTITTGEAKPRGTFVDENAMLIHHNSMDLRPVDVEWAHPSSLRKTYPPQDAPDGAAWVCNLLHGMDLPCYSHTFYEAPATNSRLRASVYTVLEPAPGADGKDCLILTTSQDLSGSAEQLLYTPTFAGLSVSLAILKHLKDNAGWMSKRLILLIVDEESESDYTERFHLGVKAFVDDYHLHTLDLLERHQKDSAMARSIRHSGVIRAAISLDLSGPCVSDVVQLLTTGLNGELPNMDLLNAAVFQFERQGVDVILDRCSSPLDNPPHSSCPDAAAAAEVAMSRLIPLSTRRSALQGYLDRLFAMLGFIGSVATGPSGPHAHFLQHSVDALTIRSVRQSGGHGGGNRGACSKSLRVSAGAVLSIARGISNLEEELHHSFFVYFMLSTAAFVSIGEYAYVMVLLLFPLAMQAGRLPRLYKDKTLLRALLIVGTFEGFGALLFLAASVAPEPSPEALYRYLNLVTIAGYVLVAAVRLFVYPRRPAGKLVEGSTLPWEGTKMVMACLVAYFCSVTALLSWPLAAVLALTHVPLFVMAKPLSAASVARSCVMLPFMLFSMPTCWPWLLGAATGRESGGITVISQWLRWHRVSGLLNVPLLCLVSIPTHLTMFFVFISPQDGA